MARSPVPPLPELHCVDAAGWEAWLEEHHATSPGVWLMFAKKGGGARSVSYAQALEVAICFGWIDGQVKRYDAAFYLQRFTPRRPRSVWSQINREKAIELAAAGRMRPAGAAAVAAAQADGRWDNAYAPQSTATVPDDLQRALEADPAAAEFFASLTGVRRYAFLYRLHQVRNPERRAARIAEYVALLRERRTLN